MRLKVLPYLFNKFLDKLVEKILAFEDYFFRFNTLRLSELYLFTQSVLWFVWFLIFDTANSSPVYKYMFSQWLWAIAFGCFAGAHLWGVLMNSQRVRSIIVTGYGVLWFVWGSIASYAAIASTATPTMFNLCLLSIAVAVHLSRKET